MSGTPRATMLLRSVKCYERLAGPSEHPVALEIDGRGEIPGKADEVDAEGFAILLDNEINREAGDRITRPHTKGVLFETSRHVFEEGVVRAVIVKCSEIVMAEFYLFGSPSASSSTRPSACARVTWLR